MRLRIANTDAGCWAQKQTMLELNDYTTVAVVRCNGVTPRVAVSISFAGITCFSFPCRLNATLFWNHCHSTLFGVCPWVDFHSKSRLHRASMHNGGSVFTKNGTSIPRAEPTLSKSVWSTLFCCVFSARVVWPHSACFGQKWSVQSWLQTPFNDHEVSSRGEKTWTT